MRGFKHILIATCGIISWAAADEVWLGGGGRLTGTVRAMNEEGTIELTSELSPSPLQIRRQAINKVTFPNTQTNDPLAPAIVELTNGDTLPATLQSLDNEGLAIVSPAVGTIKIPRAAIRSLQLGVARPKIIYAGPRNLEEWTRDSGAKNWTFDRQALIANGPALASKSLTLPTSFVLRFDLKWQPRQAPSYQVFFADPLGEKGLPCDRYYLQFNAAGLEIKRESKQGKRYHTLKQIRLTPVDCPDQQLHVELRVDRQGARFQLLLNDKLEGGFADPVTPLPTGNGIALACMAAPGSPQEIRNLEITEFNDARRRHHAEDRGDSKVDSLISRDEERWSGRLEEIRPHGADPMFRFRAAFQKDLLEVPASAVSTVFLADAPSQPETEVRPLVLRLRGDGSVQVQSCQFNGEAAIVRHSLLGNLSVPRNQLLALEAPGSAAGDAKSTGTQPTLESSENGDAPEVDPAEEEPQGEPEGEPDHEP